MIFGICKNTGVAALVAFSALLPACDRKGRLVTVEPKMADVAGRYHLSRWVFGDTPDAEIDPMATSAYIDLREDGSLTFHGVPVVPDSDGRVFSLQRVHTGDGTYSIAAQGSTAKREFYGLSIDCGDLPDPMNAPRLREGPDSLTLSFEYFDGDFVERMAFTRNGKLKASSGR